MCNPTPAPIIVPAVGAPTCRDIALKTPALSEPAPSAAAASPPTAASSATQAQGWDTPRGAEAVQGARLLALVALWSKVAAQLPGVLRLALRTWQLTAAQLRTAQSEAATDDLVAATVAAEKEKEQLVKSAQRRARKDGKTIARCHAHVLGGLLRSIAGERARASIEQLWRRWATLIELDLIPSPAHPAGDASRPPRSQRSGHTPPPPPPGGPPPPSPPIASAALQLPPFQSCLGATNTASRGPTRMDPRAASPVGVPAPFERAAPF